MQMDFYRRKTAVARPKTPVSKQRVQVSYTLPREVVTKIEQLARKRDQPLSRIVEDSLRRDLKVGEYRAA
jgi:hypothetical protein